MQKYLYPLLVNLVLCSMESRFQPRSVYMTSTITPMLSISLRYVKHQFTVDPRHFIQEYMVFFLLRSRTQCFAICAIRSTCWTSSFSVETNICKLFAQSEMKEAHPSINFTVPAKVGVMPGKYAFFTNIDENWCMLACSRLCLLWR